jgi:hypothetical protein
VTTATHNARKICGARKNALTATKRDPDQFTLPVVTKPVRGITA